jgi:hypothetical protein
MTSFNDILTNEITENLDLDSEKSEILFNIDENTQTDRISNMNNEQHQIRYLDSSKIYNPRKKLGDYVLKMHQTTTLYYMIELEKMLYSVKTLTINKEIEYTEHYTNIGILSDQVGAGKSYCIMALLNENKDLITKNLPFRNNSIGSSNITPKKINNLKTNILLVPHSLIGQWSNYLDKSGLKYYTVQKSKDIYGIADNKCKFKDNNYDDETLNTTEDTKSKKKGVRKNAKTDTPVVEESIVKNTDKNTDETTDANKPKKKITLKIKTKQTAKKESVVEPSIVEPTIELTIEPETKTNKINLRKTKSDKKKELDNERRVIMNEISNVNNSINALYHEPNYRFMANNTSERELIHKKITDLNILLSKLNIKYSEINNAIKNFELEYGNISPGQITLLNDFFTIYNDKHNKCYNPNIITKDLQEFSKNMSHINKPYVESLDLILVSDSFYNLFSLYLTKDNYTVNRIIIDECNSIKGVLLFNINTIFTWLVTSSINSLMTNTGSIYKENIAPQGYYYNIREKTIMSTGFILNTISRLYENKDNSKLYFINNPEYVKKSILLPEMKTYLIICKDNVVIQVLNGVVSNDIMRMLNAGDIEGIIAKLDVVFGNESNIISIITQKYTDDLLIKEYELKVAIENPKYKAETESISINNKRIAIKDLKYKISCIEDRIKNADSCPICIDDFINPIITPCCNNKYCFNCITLSLNVKQNCPSCRNPLDVSKLLVLSEKNKPGINNSGSNASDSKLPLDLTTYLEKLDYFKSKSLSYTKYENMDKIFELNNNNPVKKYLIFTEYESTLNTKITSILDKWNLKYDRIRGSTATINKQLDKYKNPNGETNVLLVNSKFFGSGMNLENTSDIIIMHKMQSDIEMQAIGRAQRFGREGELRIWKLYYQNEVALYFS